MPQLLRDNAGDARVVEDIDALARAYDDGAIAASAEAMRTARAADLASLADAFGDESSAGTPWWRSAADQIIRYRFYAAAVVVVLAVILFRSPVPLPSADSGDAATHLIPTADSEPAITSEPGPPFEPAPTQALAFALPGTDYFPPVVEEPSTEPAPPAPSAPKQLRFTQTGYASAFAGTPVDTQPPKNGLPVEAVTGQVTKYSYARLSGGGTVLKLRALTDDGASLNATEARVQLCPVKTGWAPKRATPMPDAPGYYAQCLEGHNSGGVWSFTFSAIANPLEPNGWAIVPFTVDNSTFRVTFAPTAV